MSRGLMIPLLLFAVFAASVPFALRAEEPQEPKEPKGAKLNASGRSPDADPVKIKDPDAGTVVRNAEELVTHLGKPGTKKDPAAQKATTAELVKYLGVQDIDWSKQMVVVVQGHLTRGEAGSIKFDPPT